MDNRMNPERAAGTAEPEHQGPRPVPYTYHDGREDYLHVGRREGAERDQPEALVPPAEGVTSPVQATSPPPEAASVAAAPITCRPRRRRCRPRATALPPAAMPGSPWATPRAAAPRPQQASRTSEIVTRGLRTGAVLTAATMCTMMAASTIKRGSPWAATERHGGGGRPRGRRVSAGSTRSPLRQDRGARRGLLAWGIGYEKALDAAGQRGGALTGALSALGGFLLDDLVLPGRLMTGPRATMGVVGTVGEYVALGVASAVAPRWRAPEAPARAPPAAADTCAGASAAVAQRPLSLPGGLAVPSQLGSSCWGNAPLGCACSGRAALGGGSA